VMAYKIERPRDEGKQWDIYRLEPTAAGILHYESPHAKRQ
jgi:hypothetical protein